MIAPWSVRPDDADPSLGLRTDGHVGDGDDRADLLAGVRPGLTGLETDRLLDRR